MTIGMQIISLTVSFLCGIFTFFVYNYVSKWLFSTKTVYKIFLNLLFVLIITFLYFFIMMKINNAIIHIYFLLVFAFSFLLSRCVWFKYKRSKLLKK